MIAPIIALSFGPATAPEAGPETTETVEGSEAVAPAPADADAEPPATGEPSPAEPALIEPAWGAASTPPETAPGGEPAPIVAPVPAAAPTPATPRPPRPIRWRLDFGVGGGSTLVGDLGYRAFAERRHLPELAVSSVFDFRLAEGRVFLGGGLAYQRTATRGDAFDTQVGAGVSMHEPEVLGRVSVRTIEGIDAFARVGVGPSFVDLDFDSRLSAVQSEVIPRVDGQAGLSLYLPKAWLPRKQASRITAGLELGMGYTWRGKIAVQPRLSQDDDPLRATTSPWGDLSMHGLSWRVGLFLRVM